MDILGSVWYEIISHVDNISEPIQITRSHALYLLKAIKLFCLIKIISMPDIVKRFGF